MSDRERFDSKWTPEPFSGCWLWTSTVRGRGYGQFWMNGTMRTAHRTAWELYRGEIPEGMLLLHRCDTKECVNPDHLFLGTQADNMADMIAKGRGNSPRFIGESHGSAKLTESQVLQIRSSGGLLREVAVQFNISVQTVSDIRNGKKWKHLLNN